MVCRLLQDYGLRGAVKKKPSIFTDIIQIDVDPPPSYPIFDKFIFDTVLIMLTSLPPLEFLTKNLAREDTRLPFLLKELL